MSEDIFREIKGEGVQLVLNALKKDWPKHFILHQVITVCGDYEKAGIAWKNHLYLYGDLETGAYMNRVLIENSHRRMNFLYIYTANSDLTDMKKALLETHIIPWDTKDFIFHAVDNRFIGIIQEAFAAKHKTCEVTNNTLFVYPIQKDIHMLPIPEDTFIDFLNETHAAEMDRNWPHRSPGSALVIIEHLQKNFGLGLFRKSDKKLLCSSLSNFMGGVFVLFTDPKFRGRGYASIIVQHMVQECRKRGRIPFCTVVIGNKPPEHMFSKLGFEPFTKADYIAPKGYYTE